MTNLMLSEPVVEELLPSRRPPAGFWLVATGLFALTAFSTAPSGLYGIYAREDHLSPLTITLVYAVYAAGLAFAVVVATGVLLASPLLLRLSTPGGPTSGRASLPTTPRGENHERL